MAQILAIFSRLFLGVFFNNEYTHILSLFQLQLLKAVVIFSLPCGNGSSDPHDSKPIRVSCLVKKKNVLELEIVLGSKRKHRRVEMINSRSFQSSDFYLPSCSCFQGPMRRIPISSTGQSLYLLSTDGLPYLPEFLSCDFQINPKLLVLLRMTRTVCSCSNS